MKIIKLICALLPFFLLQGCFDSRDVKDVAIVMGIGVETGEEKTYKTSVQVIVPTGVSKDGTGDTFENYSGDGMHIGECIENATAKCEKYMYMSHATSLLISDEIATAGIYEMLDYFMRDNELRSSLNIAVAEGSVNEIMNTESKLLKVPLSAVATLERRFKETALGQYTTVYDMISDILKKDCATLVPVISSKNNESIISGSGVFKNGKMISKISNQEARGALWLLNKIKNTIITIEHDGATLDIKVKNAKAKIKPNYNNEEIIINAQVKCDVKLLRDDKGVLNAYGTEAVKEFINSQIKSETLAVFDKMQSINADVYGFSEMVYKESPQKWQMYSESGELFQKVKLDLVVETVIEDEGSILKSAKKAE